MPANEPLRILAHAALDPRQLVPVDVPLEECLPEPKQYRTEFIFRRVHRGQVVDELPRVLKWMEFDSLSKANTVAEEWLAESDHPEHVVVRVLRVNELTR